jgi:hypothetical protein
MLHQSKVRKIADEFGIKLIIHCIDDSSSSKTGELRFNSNQAQLSYQYEVELNLFKEHFFLEEKTSISSYYINHIDIEPFERHRLYKDSHGRFLEAKDAKHQIRSSLLVRRLLEKGFFKPLTYGEKAILSTTFYHTVRDLNCSLDFNPDFCTRLITAPESTKKVIYPSTFRFADFECDPNADKDGHIEYLCVVENAAYESASYVFRGPNCGEELLKLIPHNNLVYFHNLTYDIRFLARNGIQSAIQKGSQVKQATIAYQIKITLQNSSGELKEFIRHSIIHFGDSYGLIPEKLANFPSMFNLKGVQKELFPYNYYSIERLEKTWGVTDEA